MRNVKPDENSWEFNRDASIPCFPVGERDRSRYEVFPKAGNPIGCFQSTWDFISCGFSDFLEQTTN